MKSITKRIAMASLLAGLGVVAIAQGKPNGHAPDHKGGAMMHDRMDPAKMQAHMEKRAAELKAKLKITPAQEGAWTSFTSAMKPPANMVAMRLDRAEMDKLSTPERIDKMKAMRVQRDAEMDKRSDAVKTFYAVLTPEQKKVFDAERLMRGPDRGGRGEHGRGHPDGRPAPAPQTKP
jgi:Spy/CpxP family protein refolding chaperone